jgi:hypothetical protein
MLESVMSAAKEIMIVESRRRAFAEGQHGSREQRIRRRKWKACRERGRRSGGEATSAGRATQLDPSLLGGRAGNRAKFPRHCRQKKGVPKPRSIKHAHTRRSTGPGSSRLAHHHGMLAKFPTTLPARRTEPRRRRLRDISMHC